MSTFIENVFKELQEGKLTKQLDEHIKQISFAYGNIPGGKMPKPHNAQLVITLDFSSGGYPDRLIVQPSVKAKIPEPTGCGNATFKKDATTDTFFINPKTGEISINPIVQDDIDYQTRAQNITPISKTK
jgi:hypothetical protein